MTEDLSLPLPEATVPEYRRDPISGFWTIFAPDRAHRPVRFEREPPRPDARDCPFCVGRETMTPAEVFAERDQGPPDSPGWRIRVVPNRYPAVRGNGSAGERFAGELLETAPGIGRHEIVVECAEHDWTISGQSDDQVAAIFQTYRRRLEVFRQDRSVRYALIFKNAGERAGASQEHAHSQILGTSHVPPLIDRELERCRAHWGRHGRGLFLDLLESETRSGERIAAATKHFVAICPYASRFPCEVWILPRQPLPRFEEHPIEQFGELGQLVKNLLVRLETILPRPAYNYYLHTSPFDGVSHPYYHWHVELAPRVVGLAGCELGGGMFINPVPPEWAARLLRGEIGGARSDNPESRTVSDGPPPTSPR